MQFCDGNELHNWTEAEKKCQTRANVCLYKGNGITSYTTLHALRSQFCVFASIPLQWRHNGRDGVSNHQPHVCLFNRLFRHWRNNTSKLRVSDLCEGNSPMTTQSASNAENVSIWWRHHAYLLHVCWLISCRCLICENKISECLNLALRLF